MRGAKPYIVSENANPVNAVPKPPDWFTDEARAEWRRVAPILVDRRILTDGDLGSLENYCIAIGTVRIMERELQRDGYTFRTESGAIKRNPAIGIQSDAMNRARLYAAELGLTPVSRSRPSVRDDDDGFGDLFER